MCRLGKKRSRSNLTMQSQGEKRAASKREMREVTVEVAEKIERVGSHLKTALQGGECKQGVQRGWWAK